MKLSRSLAAAFAVLSLLTAAYAGDPSGNWKWTRQGRNGPVENSGKFALADGKLSGTVTSPRGQLDISDASCKDDAIAFVTVVSMGGNNFSIKYEGKLEGDTIKGTIERPGRDGGPPNKQDWNATRVK